MRKKGTIVGVVISLLSLLSALLVVKCTTSETQVKQTIQIKSTQSLTDMIQNNELRIKSGRGEKNIVSISATPMLTPKTHDTPRLTQKPTAKKPTIETKQPTKTPMPTISGDKGIMFTVSAYDLSVESCGKSRSNKDFGRTRSGYNLANKSRESAMTIAADTRILKMGTKVYLSFISSHVQHCNGVYTVRDTGGAIRGRKLDLYFGDDAGVHKRAMNFGVQKAYVKVLD